MSTEKFTRRAAAREAYCRCCDSVISKGQQMVSGYSWRNRGQNIHICLPCGELIGKLAAEPVQE